MSNSENSNLESLKQTALANRVDLSGIEKLSMAEQTEEIRSRLNGIVFANVEKAMLPNWALRTIWAGGKRQAVPRQLANDAYRNWTVIGAPGGNSFAISDISGLTTAHTFSGSIEFWPIDKSIIYPSLADWQGPKLQILSLDDQVYEWTMSTGPITFRRLIYHIAVSDKEYLANEIILQNVSLEERRFSFCAVLRPFSVRGIEPITALRYDEPTCSLYSNESLSLESDRLPSALMMTVFDDPCIASSMHETSRFDKEFTTARGVATAILRYDIRLGPAGVERLLFLSPLFESETREATIEMRLFDRYRDSTVTAWFDFREEYPSGEYPNEEITLAAAQANAALAIQVKEWIHSLTPIDIMAGIDDVVRILSALTRSGFGNLARDVAFAISNKLKTRDLVGKDSLTLAPLYWAINEMNSISQSSKATNELVQFQKSIRDSLETNAKQCVAEAVTRPPSTAPSESFQNAMNPIEQTPTPIGPEPPPTLAEILREFWIYAATTSMLPKDPEMSKAIESYRSKYETRCKRLLIERSWDYESADDIDTMLKLLSGYSLTNATDAGNGLFEALVNGLREKRFSRGLFRYPGEEGRISSHLALRIAHAFVHLGARHESELLLENITRYLSEFHQLPEWINLKSKGGSLGNGCSIEAAADLKLLLRDMMIYERNGVLFVFAGIPEAWFTSESPLSVRGIPTGQGLVSIDTGVSANQHQIEIDLDSLPEELEVCLPMHIPLHMVKVVGGSVIDRLETPNNRIRIIPLSGQVAITFHR
jgi:hypothetical protein